MPKTATGVAACILLQGLSAPCACHKPLGDLKQLSYVQVIIQILSALHVIVKVA